MNKYELVKEVSEKAEVTQKDTDRVISTALEVITLAVASGTKVTLVGFGTFEQSERKAREGRNPKTGDTIQIPAAVVPKFSAGKGFKDAVNS